MTMLDGQLIARKTSDDPIIYRVIFDDGTGPVEVGSVSERTRHTQRNEVYLNLPPNRHTAEARSRIFRSFSER